MISEDTLCAVATGTATREQNELVRDALASGDVHVRDWFRGLHSACGDPFAIDIPWLLRETSEPTSLSAWLQCHRWSVAIIVLLIVCVAIVCMLVTQEFAAKNEEIRQLRQENRRLEHANHQRGLSGKLGHAQDKVGGPELPEGHAASDHVSEPTDTGVIGKLEQAQDKLGGPNLPEATVDTTGAGLGENAVPHIELGPPDMTQVVEDAIKYDVDIRGNTELQIRKEIQKARAKAGRGRR